MASVTKFSEMSVCSLGTLAEDGSECFDFKKECCPVNNCGEPDTRPPYARTMPEGRRFGVVISNDDPCAEYVDISLIMGHVFEIVEKWEIPKLRFTQCVPISEFCGKMLVVCQDEETSRWLICALKTLCPPHSAVTFIKFFGLIRCSVLLPVHETRHSTCKVFSFFEAQNDNIKTHKWSVVGRRDVDTCEAIELGFEPIQDVLENEVMDIFMDRESIELIKGMCPCSRLKYFLWTVQFIFYC